MSLGSDGWRFESLDGSSASGSRIALERPLASWLARLGPVLLVRGSGCVRLRQGRRSCAIDSFGVRESLHFDDCRIYRLADSDYLGWEHIAAVCRDGVAPRIDRAGAPMRRAHVVRSAERTWIPVTQLSALGWQQVEEILCWEGARLEPVSGEDAMRWHG
jgi:hypothetical protein